MVCTLASCVVGLDLIPASGFPVRALLALVFAKPTLPGAFVSVHPTIHTRTCSLSSAAGNSLRS